MDFAERITNLEPEGAYAVLARAQALEATGRDIVHLEIGQPDFPTAPHISKAGAQAILNGHTRYTPPAGLPELRKAIAAQAGAQRSVQFEAEQVVIGPGAKPGLFFPTLAVVNPGDEVVYPDPGFPTYPEMVTIAGGRPVPVPLLENNQFSFDLEAFDRSIGENTRLIILNSPANPTGGVIPLSDLEHIAGVAQDNNCWVISDEIYARLVYESEGAPSIASLPGMSERTIIVDGFSKTYAMTGWRLGFAILPLELAARLELLLTHSIGCTATFTQIAGLEALNGDQEQIALMVKAYRERRDRIVEGLNSIPGIDCQLPQGAFYAFPDVRSFGISTRVLARRLLDEAGVAVLPGEDFGRNGEGYLRMSYAASLEDIDKALERLRAFFLQVASAG
jgi:aspartate/methionine/tyrosine aminotransferase